MTTHDPLVVSGDRRRARPPCPAVLQVGEHEARCELKADHDGAHVARLKVEWETNHAAP